LKLLWHARAWDDYVYWQQNEPSTLLRLNDLIRDTQRSPFSGIGKPEPLRANLSGWWSRRITGEHRLVYRCQGSGDEQRIEIIQCRYHY
jgi:toxin YoeB